MSETKNNSPLKLILPLVLLAALVAVFFMWKKGDDSGKKKDEVAEKAPTADAKERVERPDKAQGNGARSGGNRGEATVLLDDDPEGHLRLEGIVLTSTDDPVAGAVVSISSRPPRFVRTEEDGSFAFDNLVGRAYDLVARAPDGVAGPVTARLTETNDPVTLVLKPGGSVKVTVVSAESGEAIDGASVELRGLDNQEVSTDATGVASFAPVVMGRHRVVAKKSGFTMAQSSAVVSRSGAVADVRLEMRGGAPVAGVVIDPEGNPLEGARVIYRGASEWSVRADPRLDGVLTNDKGEFRFDALPKGSFRFVATAKDFADGSSEMVSLPGDSETTGVEIQMAAGATLRGVVVDNNGAPVPAARVRVGVQMKSGMGRRRGGGVRQAYSDDEGKFEMTGLPRRPHELVALHEDASSAIEDVDLSVDPFEAEATLTLDIDGTIAGTVIDSQGEPVAGAQVMVFPDWRSGSGSPSSWRMRGISEELTDAGGGFKVKGLEDGQYEVRAIPGNATSRGRAWLTEGVKAKPGDENLEIVLPADGGIKGRVTFANGDVPSLFTVSVGWAQGTPFSSKKGEFELPDLPPQEFTLTIKGPDFDTKSVGNVEVKEGEVIDIGEVTVSKGRVVSGKVVDKSGSPVAGAKVQAGRMIFGSGSSTNTRGRGHPLARDTKEGTTDENGEFSISGVQPGDLSIVAEHETLGRSLPISVQQNRDSVVDVTLALEEVGSLEGIVTLNGQPADGVSITASSLTSAGVKFAVATGADGSYRFDRLTADAYHLSAVTDGNPMRGMGSQASTAQVSSGQVAVVNMELVSGEVTLEVKVDAGEQETGFVWIGALQGAASQLLKARDFHNAVNAAVSGYEGQAMSVRGSPANLPGMSPGRYIVCAIPYPTQVSGMQGTLDYMAREGDDLDTFCENVTLTEAAGQSVSISVTIPDFVPAP